VTLDHGPAVGSAQQSVVDIGLLACTVAERDEADTARGATSAREIRKMICTFRPVRSSPEETYSGAIEIVADGLRLSPDRTMIWIVKGTAETKWPPGALQQAYVADPTATLGHPPLLIGETNTSIALLELADTPTPIDREKQPASRGRVVLLALSLMTSPA
jgi:Protein of unknown function (DUF992)